MSPLGKASAVMNQRIARCDVLSSFLHVLLCSSYNRCGSYREITLSSTTDEPWLWLSKCYLNLTDAHVR